MAQDGNKYSIGGAILGGAREFLSYFGLATSQKQLDKEAAQGLEAFQSLGAGEISIAESKMTELEERAKGREFEHYHPLGPGVESFEFYTTENTRKLLNQYNRLTESTNPSTPREPSSDPSYPYDPKENFNGGPNNLTSPKSSARTSHNDDPIDFGLDPSTIERDVMHNQPPSSTSERKGTHETFMSDIPHIFPHDRQRDGSFDEKEDDRYSSFSNIRESLYKTGVQEIPRNASESSTQGRRSSIASCDTTRESESSTQGRISSSAPLPTSQQKLDKLKNRSSGHGGGRNE